MFFYQRQHTLPNDLELLRRRQLAGHWSKILDFQHFLETGDADHEELVKVVGKHREKLKFSSSGTDLSSRLFKQTAKEFQLAQIAVEDGPRQEPASLLLFRSRSLAVRVQRCLIPGSCHSKCLLNTCSS